MIFRDLVAGAGQPRELVDHLALDQRRVHVERNKASIAAEDRVVLERDVDLAGFGDRRQRGSHAILVHLDRRRRRGGGELDAEALRGCIALERRARREAVDAIDVEPVRRHHARYLRDVRGRDRGTEHRDDESPARLGADPLAILIGARRRELHFDAELVRLEQEIGQDRRRAQRLGHLDQDPERKAVVNDRLADVEDARVVAREDRGERVRQPRPVVAGDADQQRTALPRREGQPFRLSSGRFAIADVTSRRDLRVGAERSVFGDVAGLGGHEQVIHAGHFHDFDRHLVAFALARHPPSLSA